MRLDSVGIRHRRNLYVHFNDREHEIFLMAAPDAIVYSETSFTTPTCTQKFICTKRVP